MRSLDGPRKMGRRTGSATETIIQPAVHNNSTHIMNFSYLNGTLGLTDISWILEVSDIDTSLGTLYLLNTRSL